MPANVAWQAGTTTLFLLSSWPLKIVIKFQHWFSNPDTLKSRECAIKAKRNQHNLDVKNNEKYLERKTKTQQMQSVKMEEEN